MRFFFILTFAIAGMAQQPLATVGGQPITEQDLAPLIQSQLAQLRSQEFELRSRYLEMLINQKVVEAEAKRRNLTVEQLIEQDVCAKIGDPTEAELAALYEKEKDRLKKPLAEVKAQLITSYKDSRLQPVGEAYMRSLREKAGVQVLMEPPRMQVRVDTNRIRGERDAPITIVEFSDYQCPFCARAQPTLREVLAKYPGKVRLSFRDLPIREIHPQAEPAAIAARCAGDQGKYWEFHDLIYQNQSAAKLANAGLLEHARTLQLDMKAFETCQASGKFKTAIERDIDEAGNLGASGTPAFFVNGIFLNGAVPFSEFQKVIDRELATLAKRAAH
jgi:protein-disulfide isomerase